jgi:membrane protease YdiL (CAAX protease family)
MRSPPATVRTYLLLAVVFSTAIYVPILRSGELGPLTIALMWAPGVAALLAQLIHRRTVRGLGWRLGAPRHIAAGLLIPLAGCVIVYGMTWLAGLGALDTARIGGAAADAGLNAAFSPLWPALLGAMAQGLTLGAVFALGEEIGWRGLLVPELFRTYGFRATVLLSAGIWSLYHYPAILGTGYHSAAPVAWVVAMFTLMVLGVSVIAAWLRLRSGSLWPAVFLHASHNTFVQSIFDPLTADGRWTPYITTEFGAGLMAFYGVVAVYFWRLRGELRSVDVQARRDVRPADIRPR